MSLLHRTPIDARKRHPCARTRAPNLELQHYSPLGRVAVTTAAKSEIADRHASDIKRHGERHITLMAVRRRPAHARWQVFPRFYEGMEWPRHATLCLPPHRHVLAVSNAAETDRFYERVNRWHELLERSNARASPLVQIVIGETRHRVSLGPLGEYHRVVGVDVLHCAAVPSPVDEAGLAPYFYGAPIFVASEADEVDGGYDHRAGGFQSYVNSAVLDIASPSVPRAGSKRPRRVSVLQVALSNSALPLEALIVQFEMRPDGSIS